MDTLGLLSLRTTFFVLGAIFFLYPSAVARMRSLPLPPKLRDCYLRAKSYSAREYVGDLYAWYCESSLGAYIEGSPSRLLEPQEAYHRHLYNLVEAKILPQDNKKHKFKRCQRKEYRVLTDEERQRFHNALNVLKRDTSVEPNKYDALATYHTGKYLAMAHRGPGFPGWHTVFLLLFEAALQEVDSKICLPYWDSSLDAGLLNPAESYIWSDDFLGDKERDVTTGPFANWSTPGGVTLRRNVGLGQLFTREAIEYITSRSTIEDILEFNTPHSLEDHHGGPHVFVGGDMASQNTAARDPVFFLHHAFVDYIWLMARKKMKKNGVDTERYPEKEFVDKFLQPSFHQGTALMGFGNLTQADGFRDSLTSSYEYMPSPSCYGKNTKCGSKYLWCDVTSAQCIPIDPNNPPEPLLKSSTSPPRPQAYQNSFCINGVCNINRWVWMPVRIVSKRPPEFLDYHSYPVRNGKIDKTKDIYQPSAYPETYKLIKGTEGNPKSYDKCEVTDGVGSIFISSKGVNYDGIYKESAIIDQHTATSISVAYIAVKDPAIQGDTEVLFRAADQCGRVCHTACKVPGSSPPRYEVCSGLVEVTSKQPLAYGQTYADATLQVYNYNTSPYCPTVMGDFFITFYCDYVDFLPWV